MSTERIFVTGPTGKVGSLVVRELIKRDVSVTVYARSPEKVQKNAHTTVVQGDFNDLTPFENAISGHTRLFCSLWAPPTTQKPKPSLHKRHMTPVVDLSAIELPWRTYALTNVLEQAEEKIFNLPNRGSYVSLRPTNFMTDTLYVVDSIKTKDAIIDAASPEELQEWISPRDIAEVGVNVLLDPVEKHGDAAYELIGDLITPVQRAAILTGAVRRKITYKQIPVQELYDFYLKMFNFYALAYYLAAYNRTNPVVRGLPILLGREPESYEACVANNKQAFQ
ncbi:hypothetical protein BDB00DRAFT_880815 [Zychaea mexicana]|uniref:uncharacterized protein n=1 Tax=Zychaea mexicana TaxID=64656 RepID=UPI0022FF1011|nr:uncharacterized protein BDB00DRAFT_880815 [Zychaea mexicana]KAI9499594.1 hypothetical protein BDB00DRAFT_880815 [Zychaea mexicana]